MSNYMTRFAVIVKDIYHNERHYEHPRESYYVAKTVTNTQGGRMTTEGREYTFGKSGDDEVDFYEVDTEEEASQVASRFNRLYQKGVYASIRKLRTRS